MAMEKRPIAKPNTTMAAPVRTQAKNVRSLARWSRARLGLEFGSITSVGVPPALFHSLGDKGASACQILDQVGGHAVPILQILGIVVRHGGLAVRISGNQNL